MNSVLRASNGPLISTPGNVNIIGNVRQPNPTYARYFNTCYENSSGALAQSTGSAPACDALSPTPAYQQRLSYTTQLNSTVYQRSGTGCVAGCISTVHDPLKALAADSRRVDVAEYADFGGQVLAS